MNMDRVASYQRWQAARQDELAGPDSWLGLIGLIWLEPGENAVGNSADCPVWLPAGPARLGSLWVDGSDLAWQAAAGSGAVVEGGGAVADGWQVLLTDHGGPPSRVAIGSLEFFVIEREGRQAVRLRDRNWAAGRPPPELTFYDYDPVWRVEALWQQIATPQSMEVPNVSGELKVVEVTHQAVFEMAGQEVRLLPMSVNENEVFFVFRDRTSGAETYGAGRFLKVPAGVDGKICLDFNRAYNPPCAFTPFATCPLPPPENWLPFAVPAGEKKWVKVP
jgi:uncharacterized protein